MKVKNNNELEFFRPKKIKKKLSSSQIDTYYRFQNFCKKNEPSNNNYYRFGFEAFGVILFNFCTWLIADLKKENISRILFLSRDGYIIKRAFELIPGHEDFDTEYLYVSRRSLRVPALHFEDESRFDSIFPTRFISIQDLLSSIGLDPEEYADTVNNRGFSLDTVIRGESIKNDIRVISLLDDVWDAAIDNSKKEYKSTVGYLNRFIFGQRVAIVDIGWRGTIQHYLNKILKGLGTEIQTRGYYITLNSDFLRGMDMHGYLMNVDNKSDGCDLLRGYVGLIETLFLRTEGSTRRYEYSEGQYKPVLDEYEYCENSEYTWEARAITDIQTGALEFIKTYIMSGEDFLRYFNDIMTFYNLNELATNPTISDVKMFANFRFLNNGSITHLAKCESMFYYIMHPGILKKDFYASRWRIGFMKNLFKIPLPYNAMMKLLMTYVKSNHA